MFAKLKTLVLVGMLAALVTACGASAAPPATAPTAVANPQPTAAEAPTAVEAAPTAAAEEPTATGADAQPTAAAEAPTTSAVNPDLKPIKIGLAAPMTGANSSVGEGAQMGVTLAIEDLGGQIDGHAIELYTVDDKCAPTDTVTAVRRLIDEEQVDAIIGPLCSGSTLAALPIIQEGEVPQLSVTSSNATIYDEIGVGANEWAFRLNLDDLIIAKTLASYIAKDSKNIFIIGQNNDFGRGGAAAYAEELPKVNVTIAGSEFYDDGTTDFRPLLAKIKQSGADSIMTFMVEQDSAPFFRQMKEVGLNVKVYTRGGVTSPLFLQMTEDDPTLAEGAIGASYWTSGLDPEAEQRFTERWNSPPTVHRMMSYYGMKLIFADAIHRALEANNGELTREGIRDALTTVNLPGTPIGDLSFDEHHQAYPFLTLDTIKDGKITLLGTVPGVHR